MSLADWFKSAAEKQVDAIYGGSVPPSVSPIEKWAADPFGFHAVDDAYESFKEAVTPESYGEAEVRRMLETDPLRYELPADHADYSSPNVYVKAKGAISDTVSAVRGAFAKYLILGVVVLLILAVGYSTALYGIRKKVFS